MSKPCYTDLDRETDEMTINQLFFSIVGVMGIFAGAFKLYFDSKIDGSTKNINTRIDGVETNLNSKIDGLAKQVDLLVNYMILHSEKIATLEERTKNL